MSAQHFCSWPRLCSHHWQQVQYFDKNFLFEECLDFFWLPMPTLYEFYLERKQMQWLSLHLKTPNWPEFDLTGVFFPVLCICSSHLGLKSETGCCTNRVYVNLTVSMTRWEEGTGEPDKVRDVHADWMEVLFRLFRLAFSGNVYKFYFVMVWTENSKNLCCSISGIWLKSWQSSITNMSKSSSTLLTFYAY